jgi:hypothetical protein
MPPALKVEKLARKRVPDYRRKVAERWADRVGAESTEVK